MFSTKALRSMLISTILFIAYLDSVHAQSSTNQNSTGQANPVLWRQPEDIGSRDLRFGPGSPERAPVAPFIFIEEVMSGESPKFKVRDANRTVWTVKLGPEAQAETVATRLVWAVGYFAEEAYYFDQVKIENLPRLSRGKEFVAAQGIAHGARFEPQREGVTRGDRWDWGKNPFADTRELNGLKVLMILLNNYDARAENNRILIIKGAESNLLEARYVVSDLGASLGKAGGFGGKRSKNDLEDFLSTRFVMGVEDGAVKFDYDTKPTKLGLLTIVYPPYYKGEVKKEKNMRGIPVEHARWIGSLLSQLSDEQLRDAFRAAGYDAGTMEAYVVALRQRINQLTQIRQ